MRHKVIETNHAPKAVGAYSQGVEVDGTLYFSGQIGINPETNQLQEGFDAQVDQIMENIEGLLHSCGVTRTSIVKTTVFITDINNFPKVNEAYEKFFSKPYPARSCVEVSKLPKGALIEIEVMAKV